MNDVAPIPAHLDSLTKFAGLFDHTLLKPDTTPEMVRTLCREAVEYGFAGVCVNPTYVSLVARALSEAPPLRVISVVGFPLGAHRTDIKIDEALRAIGDGATELDMVMNVGYYLGGEKLAAMHDIAAVVRAAKSVPVKVILETAYLAPEQIKEVCGWCIESGAAFVKTSTGFGPRGASISDIQTMVEATQGSQTSVKASGGIRTLDMALLLAGAGATRIGSSSSVSIVQAFAQRLQV